MNALNRILTTLGDAVFSALGGVSPIVALIVISVATGIVMTIVFRYTSNQAALRDVARRTRAQMLAMKLFKDDFRVVLRSQSKLLGLVVMRLLLSLPPMAVLIVPIAFVLVQLAVRYELQPLAVGEQGVVEVVVKPDDWSAWRESTLESEHVTVQARHRDDTTSTVAWRFVPIEERSIFLRWNVEGSTIEKTVAVQGSEPHQPVSALRPGRSLTKQFLYPAEPALDDTSPIESIRIHYDKAHTPLFGWNIPWWLTFFLVSMLSALLVRPIVKVQF